MFYRSPSLSLLLLMLLNLKGALASSSLNFSPEPFVICTSIVCVIAGFILTFFGYRLFKFALFVGGFFIGCSICFPLLSLYASIGFVFTVIVSIVSGFVLGLTLVYLVRFGIVLLGAILGFLLYVHLNALQNGGLVHPIVGHYSLLAALPILGAILALIFQKALIIITTSFGGAFMIVGAYDYITLGGFSMVLPQVLNGQDAKIYVDAKKTYIEFGVIGFIFILGLLIQYTRTSKGFDHRKNSKKLQDGYAPIGDSKSSTDNIYKSYHTISGYATPMRSTSNISINISPVPPSSNPENSYPHAPGLSVRNECMVCKAKGTIPISCPSCLGRGYPANQPKLACFECSGHGQNNIRCSVCAGIGYTYSLH